MNPVELPSVKRSRAIVRTTKKDTVPYSDLEAKMDATGRRLQVLSQQLGPSPEHGDQPQLERVHTSGNEPSAEFNQLGADEPYAISLPEKLTPEGPWHVYRFVMGSLSTRHGPWSRP